MPDYRAIFQDNQPLPLAVTAENRQAAETAAMLIAGKRPLAVLNEDAGFLPERAALIQSLDPRLIFEAMKGVIDE